MAVTVTASLALSTYTPHTPHTGTHVIVGNYDGVGLSASGSGALFLGKIPPNATVTVIEEHTATGAATQVLNIGIRAQGGSVTYSALASIGGGGTSAQSNIHGPYKCTREDTTNESYKYVVASLQSGTVTASMVMKYTIIYSVADPI